MKERLDLLLVNRGLAPSREKAKTMIMEGNVFVENEREDKAGSMFDTEAKIEIKGNTLKYVSRGGLKLEKAMTHFDIELNDKSVWISGVDRRIYRLHAPEQRKKSVFCRCRIRSVCMETKTGSAGGLHGKDEHPLCDTTGYR